MTHHRLHHHEHHQRAGQGDGQDPEGARLDAEGDEEDDGDDDADEAMAVVQVLHDWTSWVIVIVRSSGLRHPRQWSPSRGTKVPTPGG